MTSHVKSLSCKLSDCASRFPKVKFTKHVKVLLLRLAMVHHKLALTICS